MQMFDSGALNNANGRIIVMLEPLVINEGICLINNNMINGYNDMFKNMFGLSGSQLTNSCLGNSSQFFSSKLIFNNLDVANTNKVTLYIIEYCYHTRRQLRNTRSIKITTRGLTGLRVSIIS